MITVKLTNEVRIQKYTNGLKIFVNYRKDNTKWFIIKLDIDQVKLLEYIIKLLLDNHKKEKKK